MCSAKNWLGISLASLLFLTACHKSSPDPNNSDVGNWVNRYEMNGNVRGEAVSFVIGDTAYVGSGFDGTERLSDFYAFNPATNSWYQTANIPGVPRNSAVAFAAAGKGYVGTGFDGVNKLNDFYVYNPANGEWHQTQPFPGTARYDAVAFAINNKGYVTTGFDGSYLKDFYQYVPTGDTTGVWTEQPDGIGTKRSGAVAFVYNNVAYVATGTNNGQLVNDFWKYDGTSWTELRKITNISTDSYDDDYSDIIRSNAAAFVMGDTAFLSTGENSGYISKTWAYIISSDQWIRRTAFEGAARSGAVGFTVQNRGYISCGKSSSQYFDDVWEFHPDETYNAND